MTSTQFSGSKTTMSAVSGRIFVIDPRAVDGQNVNELFFLLLRMGPRAALSRRQSHQVDADLSETRRGADRLGVSGVLVAVGIVVEVLGNRRCGNDERRSLFRFVHVPAYHSPYADEQTFTEGCPRPMVRSTW
jgi:hypothetical protein